MWVVANIKVRKDAECESSADRRINSQALGEIWSNLSAHLTWTKVKYFNTGKVLFFPIINLSRQKQNLFSPSLGWIAKPPLYPSSWAASKSEPCEEFTVFCLPKSVCVCLCVGLCELVGVCKKIIEPMRHTLRFAVFHSLNIQVERFCSSLC